MEGWGHQCGLSGGPADHQTGLGQSTIRMIWGWGGTL